MPTSNPSLCFIEVCMLLLFCWGSNTKKLPKPWIDYSFPFGCGTHTSNDPTLQSMTDESLDSLWVRGERWKFDDGECVNGNADLHSIWHSPLRLSSCKEGLAMACCAVPFVDLQVSYSKSVEGYLSLQEPHKFSLAVYDEKATLLLSESFNQEIFETAILMIQASSLPWPLIHVIVTYIYSGSASKGL
jgi:hypothetical protein